MSDPRCSAIAKAKDQSGLSYGEIAQKAGSTEQRVTDICLGNAFPTAQEYSALANALGITAQPPPGHISP